MSNPQWDGIKEFMKKFIERPLNQAFIHPVNPEIDGLPDYLEIVQNPMDLTQIKSKIENNKYDNACQWYSDVCLIYENAIKYHGEKGNTLWTEIAEFLLDDFKKIAKKFNVSNTQEWSKLLSEEMNKLGKKIEKSPVPQGIDDLVHSCIKRAESCPQITPQEVAGMVSRLKVALQDEEKKGCIIAILKKQKDFSIPKDADTITIEISKLSQNSLNALNLYVRAFD